jgi:hypothetical protein
LVRGAGAAITGVLGASVGALTGLLVMFPFAAFGLFAHQFALKLEQRVPFETLNPGTVRKVVAAGWAYVAVEIGFVSACGFVLVTNL